MLKNAISKWLGNNNKASDDSESSHYDTQELSECIRYFGIEDKVFYYPASRKDLKIESEILGYRINRKMVFSASDFECSGQQIKINGKTPRTIELRDVESFQMILLQNADDASARNEGSEHASDFDETELFPVNAKYSMFQPTRQKVVPSIDLRMEKSTVFKSGHLAGRSVVFLEPIVDSFSFLDRRRNRRISAHIPVQLKINENEPEQPCIIQDFSERHFRIISEKATNPLLAIDVGHNLVLLAELPDINKRFTLNGTVIRKVEGGIVFKIKGLLGNEVFESITPISEMSIKASFLTHPSAQG